MPAPRSGLPGTRRRGARRGRGVWRFRGCPRCAPGRAGFMRQGLAVSCWHIRIPGCHPRGSLSLPCVTAPGFCAPPCTGTERLRGIVIDGAGFFGWLSPGGTGYPCRCGKLNNGGFPPAALVCPAPGERTISNAAVASATDSSISPGPPSPWLPALHIGNHFLPFWQRTAGSSPGMQGAKPLA